MTKSERKKSKAELNRERQRRWYRKKIAARKNALDLLDPILERSFSKYLNEDSNWSTALASLDRVGVEPPAFDTDDDPQWDEVWNVPYRGSIGRAERAVGAFLDAATELAGIINRYKREEIDRAIGELQANLLNDVGGRSKAIDRIVELRKLRSRLDKKQRHLLPQCETKGG